MSTGVQRLKPQGAKTTNPSDDNAQLLIDLPAPATTYKFRTSRDDSKSQQEFAKETREGAISLNDSEARIWMRSTHSNDLLLQ
jgi:hypothetical protein